MNEMDRFGKGRYCTICGKYISNLAKHIRRNRCNWDLQHKRNIGG